MGKLTIGADGRGTITGTFTQNHKGSYPWTATSVNPLRGSRPAAPDRPVSPGALNFTGSWKVEDARNGRNQDYHRVPWRFSNDGTVRAEKLWRGVWERLPDNRIRVILIDTRGNTDQFDITFAADGKAFTARKNNRDYRYGKKK